LSNQLDSNNWGSGTSVALPVINEIDLPNGQKYTFQYESVYGKVEKITFPDGGYVRYVWGVNPLSALTSGAWNQQTWNGEAYVETQYNCTLEYDTPAVTDRYVSYDGSTEVLHQHFQYSTTWSGETWTQKTTTVTATDSLTGDETTTKYTYSAATSDNPPYSGESYYSTEAPVETTVDYQDGNEKEYKQVNKDWWNPNIMSAEQTILYDGNGNPNAGSAIAYCFDANEQAIGTYEYDFNSYGTFSAPSCNGMSGLNASYIGGLIRQTTTQYEPFFTWNQNGNPPYSGTHIVNAAENVTVADGGGNTSKYSVYTYDSPSTVTSSGAINLLSPPEAHRGNITTVQELISGSTYATTTYTYWDTGQVYTRTDPCGNSPCSDMTGSQHTTYYYYSDDYTSGTAPGQTFAYLTQVKNPFGQSDYFSWGFNDGLIRSHTDKNGLVTSYSYADSLARLTQISYPDNGQTNVSYNDSTYATSNSNPSANTPNMQTSGTHLNKTTIVARDGMGHTVRSMVTSDPQGTIFSDTTYDGFGRVWKQSNPYRNSDPTTSAGTTVFAYDAVSRKISDTYADGSITSTSYSGATTTVTDPSGRQRETRVNGLGFLAEADEEGYGTTPGTPGTGTATINGAEQSTQYTCGPNNQQCTMYDTGDVDITVNGTQYTYGYGQGSTDAAIASGLATAMNNGTLVTATVSGSTITMTARTDGSGTNYSLSTSVNWNTSYFTSPSFTASLSGSALTGGTNGSTGYSLGTPAVSLYAYTPLGDLRCAIQKGTDTTSFSFPLTTCGSPSSTWRPRSFTYDLLSHLLTSSNPETGTLTYTYDYNGNVWTKTDARSITTTYGYDEINRLLSRTYSNGDPTVTIVYDQLGCLNLTGCQNIGYRTSMTDAAGSESWAYFVSSSSSQTQHQDQRITSGVTKSSTYYMNQAGDPTQVVYPTGRTVNYTYNGANRPATASDSSNGITYTTAPSSPLSGCPSGQVCYTPQGSVYSMAIGKTSSFTGVNIAETFNSRLQPNTITASSTGGNAINLTYAYNDPNGHNAGDVYGITNSLNSSRSQLYAYDPLDRIQSAGTTSTTGTYCWGYLYTEDVWGNLSQSSWTPTYNSCTQANPASLTYSTRNQVTTFTYDLSGNTLSDSSHSYTWNGEGQQKTVAGDTYTYDGDGRRVVKSNGTLYWYGAGGDVLAETNSSGTTTNEYVFFGSQRVALLPAGSTAQYYVQDSLGTSRVMTNNTGGVCYDADFTPFGGERAYTNTCTENTFKFTGKERDTESGNDYFGARFYTSVSGRFLSPDWSPDPDSTPYAEFENPQTLNLYSYLNNNPLGSVDADGHSHRECVTITIGESSSTHCAWLPDWNDLPILMGGVATGHHYVPQAIWKNLDKASQQWKALNKITTRALKNPRLSNSYDQLHRGVSKQVRELVEDLEKDLGKPLKDFDKEDFEELGRRLAKAGGDVEKFNARLANYEPQARNMADAFMESLEEVFPAAEKTAEVTGEAAEGAAEVAAESGAVP
jgi:RHS repeat-associated protein